MSRREVEQLARDQRSRNTGRGVTGTPRQSRTSRGLLGNPAALVVGTPDAGVTNPPGNTQANATTARAPAAAPPNPPPAPGLTQASIDYIVTTVLNQAADSTLAKTLSHEGITSYLDLSDLTVPEVATLQYPEPVLDANGDDTGATNLATIPRHTCKLINLFNAFCRYRYIIVDDPVTIHNCMHIDHDDFTLTMRISLSFVSLNTSINSWRHPSSHPPLRLDAVKLKSLLELLK